MLTTPGHIIVHPFHGPVRIIGTTTRDLKQRSVRYLDVETLHHPLRISVPVDAVHRVGLRPLLDAQGVQRVLDLLGAPSDDDYENRWSRRIKDYQLKLQTGQVEQRVAVMREIIRQRGPYPVPGAERDLLREVRDGLTVEVSLTLGMSQAEAEAMLNDAVCPSIALVESATG
ncbi:CarD family transcriptional regulator [Microbacterium resistens]|uniref:CarD family transcriptional regulator n=1 Tax=Microbacterium resistens TaxID=156977 RepID=A0ABU1S9A9_9MICO|nr:CarD family transcriptional regulator [Microbacterium resistens]MDR6866195.1 CarD family transcriptional regulator [Microbacterium resistens]